MTLGEEWEGMATPAEEDVIIPPQPVEGDQVHLLHNMCRVGDCVGIEEFLFWMSAETRLAYLNNRTVNMFHDHTVIMAARYDQHDVINLLAGYNAALDQRNRSGSTALHHAAAKGCNGAVLALLNCGATKDEFDHEGWTPLHRAVTENHISVARGLMEMGVDINKGTAHEKKTALHLACQRGLVEMAKLLLEFGADRDVADRDGNYAIHLASAQVGPTGESLLPLCEMLLEGDKADMNLLHSKDVHGNTPLLTASKTPGTMEVALFLLDRGSNVLVSNTDGNTALHLCCAFGTGPGFEHAAVMLSDALLQKGANVDAQNKSGMTPLLLSLEASRAPVVRRKTRTAALTPSGAGGKLKTPKGKSRGRSRGNTPSSPGSRGSSSSRQKSRSSKSRGVASSSREASGGRGKRKEKSPAFSGEAFFSDDGSVGSLESLDSVGSIVSVTEEENVQGNGNGNGNGGTDNKRGRSSGDVLEGNTTSDAVTATSSTSVPERGDDTLALLLISQGADVNLAHFDGRTPLYVACSRGRPEVAELLLDKGADPLATPVWLSLASDEDRMTGFGVVRQKIKAKETQLMAQRDAADLAALEDQTRSMVL